jgi:uncharacterized protein (TIGR00730 family)
MFRNRRFDPGGKRLLVAVFGSADPPEGDPLYERARQVGGLLVAAGYGVVTGGYGGVMEGASRGAVEAGGVAVGVTCARFIGRTPNRFLTETREEADLVARTGALVAAACGYIVLHGKSGTLAELTLVWALHRTGSLGRRPVVLLGDAWRPFLHHLVRGAMIEDDQLGITRVADGPENAVMELDRFLVAEGIGGK